MYIVGISMGLLLIWLLAVLWDRRRIKAARHSVEHITRHPLDSDEVKWIERYSRIWHRLNSREKQTLRKYIRLFLHQVCFEPCGGLKEVTDEMKMAIAANACFLLVGGRQPYFQGLRDVLVYPDEFIPEKEVPEDEEEIAMGEATSNGNVILSWPDVADCGQVPFDGSNVVIHEFAHMADVVERTSIGRSPAMIYFNLNAADNFGHISERFVKYWEDFRGTGFGILDEYAGTNPAEFFAVATEFYFEVPEQFARDYPEMYRLMTDIYGKLSYQ